MGFSLPVFNLTCNVWSFGIPTSQPPRLSAVICNFCRGERESYAAPWTVNLGQQLGCMWLLVPWATDLRDTATVAGPDTVEVPAGSGRFYTIIWVDDAGYGFANAHRFAALLKLSPGPTPFPPAVGPPPPPPSGMVPISAGIQNIPSTAISVSTSTVPGKWVVARFMVISLIADFPTFVSTNVGTVFPLIVSSPYTDGTYQVNFCSLTYFDPTGSDLITVTCASNAQFYGETYQADGNFSMFLNSAGTVTPMSIGGITPTAILPILLASFIFDAGPRPSVPAPWVDPGFIMSGLSGVMASTWFMQSAIFQGPPFSPLTLSMPYPGALQWQGWLDNWPP
jgi:hypothetical protein